MLPFAAAKAAAALRQLDAAVHLSTPSSTPASALPSAVHPPPNRLLRRVAVGRPEQQSAVLSAILIMFAGFYAAWLSGGFNDKVMARLAEIEGHAGGPLCLWATGKPGGHR